MSQKFSTGRSVLICQNRSCLQQGADQVLRAFQSQDLPDDVELREVRCLGQCGSGPMVLIQPEETWYSQVHPSEVSMIVDQNLWCDQPVTQMLYPKFHPQPKTQGKVPMLPWIFAGLSSSGLALALLGLLLYHRF